MRDVTPLSRVTPPVTTRVSHLTYTPLHPTNVSSHVSLLVNPVPVETHVPTRERTGAGC